MRLCHLSCLVCVWGIAHAADPYSPKIAQSSLEAELAIRSFKVPAGMTTELFAAEPMLANPVAFCFDERGRIFVAETFRQQKGVEDNRGHGKWLLDDLAAQTVGDRIAFFKRHLKDDVRNYVVEHDRLRLLEDLDGDGRADKATVFADGFNAIEDGTGAGVLALNGNVFYTCIPKLWQMKDLDGDGISDERKVLHDGFGVRVAFRGHDLHGLVLGPDGRLYFSVGDRGSNVELKDKRRITLPDQGAVFRCELDGSNLEVYCTGLRNPQELAFDDFGNLFTGDNNSDSGDRARWVYLIEGSDSGWRMYYQYREDRGPWNREKLWHTSFKGQPAYIVPPIAHFADGPSGLTHYPGTGLDDQFRDHFFLVDFRGQASNSGIHSFSLIPNGASFELVGAQQFIWSILATDVEFGFDGGLYVTDWVDGWDGSGKGRIYRFRDLKNSQLPVVKQVTELMKQGFDARTPEQLAQFLAHPDSRIRQRAQMALVNKNAIAELVAAATKGESIVQRLHGIWGLGALGRQNASSLKPILELLNDKNSEIRAQTARVCGDANFQDAGAVLTKLVKDTNPHVQALAAIAAGKLGYQPAMMPLLEALAENADRDPTLRHALVMGLTGTATVEELAATAKMPNSAIRLGAVVALRRLSSPVVAAFLNDPNPLVVEEAARAIHDLPISPALPALAALLGQPGLSDAIARRALSANFRIGTEESAEHVASLAGNPLTEEHLRIDALSALNEWNDPGPLDRVTNEYRPIPKRNIDIAAVVRPWVDSIFAASTKVREVGIRLSARHQVSEVEPHLVEIVKDGKAFPPSLRATALDALASLKSSRSAECVEVALHDGDPVVRAQGRRVLADIDPARSIRLLAQVFGDAPVSEQQAAIQLLSRFGRKDSDAVLLGWLDTLLAGQAPPSIQLDLLNAAQLRGTDEFVAKVRAFDQKRRPEDHLKDYRESEFGGDAARGREIFFGREDVSCRRCHKIDGSGGDVGPDLSRIGLDKRRDYLLESIVDPNKQIAKGFETAILQTTDGKVYAGIIKREDDRHVQLQQPDGQFQSIEKSEIEDRAVGKSGMPEDAVKKLTKFEIRDLVEFLSTRRSAEDAAAHGKNK